MTYVGTNHQVTEKQLIDAERSKTQCLAKNDKVNLLLEFLKVGMHLYCKDKTAFKNSKLVCKNR